MTHELFKLATATPRQLDLIMSGMVFLALVVGCGALYSFWAHRRRRRPSAKPKSMHKHRRRRRGTHARERRLA